MLDVKQYIRGWRETSPIISHGTLIERMILTKAQPNLQRPGAVMQHIEKFSRAVLEGNVATSPAEHSSEQEVFYVVNGLGRIKSGDKVERINEGTAILVPPKVPHVIVNDSDQPLELLIVTEEVSPSAMTHVGKEILVRNYKLQPISVGYWSHIVRKLFKSSFISQKGEEEVGLAAVDSVLIVSLDGMTIGRPHPHGPGSDEVWYQMKGDSLLLLGDKIMRQHAGEAYMCPPDGQTKHSNINDTDQPMQWFYFAHYDEETRAAILRGEEIQ